MYVPGSLNDVEHVLINVGTGYFVEKVSESLRYVEALQNSKLKCR